MKLVTRTEAEQRKNILWWPVWTGGYVVEEVEEAGGVRYIGLDTDHGGSTMYYPLRKRLNLHYHFAHIHTEEDAKSFAASYGLLTSGMFAEKVGELWLT